MAEIFIRIVESSKIFHLMSAFTDTLDQLVARVDSKNNNNVNNGIAHVYYL